MDAMVTEPCEATADIKVSLVDGSEVPVRLRLLGFDGCEFETDHGFSPGERVSIHIYRMGWIRARIASRQARVVEAEFDASSPV
jgi:hypothetical protein